jgi:aminopeptidase N
MRNFLFTYLVLLFMAGSIGAQDYCTHQYNFSGSGGFTFQNLRPVDVRHYELFLLLNPEKREITSSARIYFNARSSLNGPVELDFAGLTIDSVRHEQTITTFNRKEDLLSIDLVNTVNPGDSSNVTVYYRGIPQAGIYFRTNLSGDTVIYSHNEPFDARYWFPCNDNPADKATMDLAVDVPAGFHVLSNGILTGQSFGPGRTIFQWRESYPIATYLISIAAARYQIVEQMFEDGAAAMPLQYFVYDGDQDRADTALQVTQEMLSFFGAYIEPYPFIKEKYAMVAVPFREAAAMENQTATTMRDDILDNESIIAHELAHQWWGDAVTPDDFEHIWLNEGFATYFDALFTEHKYGREAFGQRMQEYNGYIYTDGSLEYPILDPPPRYLFGRAVYFKGAWVLHMLRHKVGDVTFREICRQYYQAHAYGNASTRDMIAVSESISQMPLSGFFDQWLNHGGVPVLFGSWRQTGSAVSIDLEQRQDAVVYTLDLDLRIEGTGRDTTFQVVLDRPAGSWTVDFPETVVRILIDPENRVLEQNNSPLYNIPEKTVLRRTYPNPFRDRITIEYQVGIADEIAIDIVNILGETVARLERGPRNNGVYSVIWDGSGFASGIYICRLVSKTTSDYRKIILIK